DDRHNARRDDDGEAMHGVETAEDVAGEERQVEFLHPVRPAIPRSVRGCELLVAFTTQRHSGNVFAARLHANGEPRKRGAWYEQPRGEFSLYREQRCHRLTSAEPCISCLTSRSSSSIRI